MREKEGVREDESNDGCYGDSEGESKGEDEGKG